MTEDSSSPTDSQSEEQAVPEDEGRLSTGDAPTPSAPAEEAIPAEADETEHDGEETTRRHQRRVGTEIGGENLPTVAHTRSVPSGGIERDFDEIPVLLGDSTLGGAFRNLILRHLPPDLEILNQLESLIDGSRTETPTDAYLAHLVANGVLAFLLTIAGGLILAFGAWAIGVPPVSPLLVVGGAILAATVVLNVVPLFQVLLLFSEQSSREREIEEVLPHAVSFMYTQATGGSNLSQIIQSVGSSEQTYGELAREFQAIERDIQYLGVDLTTAIERQGERTPSAELSRFFIDLLSVIRSGGSLATFFDAEKERAIRTAKDRQSSRLDVLEVASEFYLVLSFVPFGILILAVIMSLIQPIPQFLLYGLVYGAVPAVGVLFALGVAALNTPEPAEGKIVDEQRKQLFEEAHYAAGHGGDSVFASAIEPDGGSEQQRGIDQSALIPETTAHPASGGVFSTPLIDAINSDHGLFTRLHRMEILNRVRAIGTNPLPYFRERPYHTLRVTLPLVVGYYAWLVLASSYSDVSVSAFAAEPLRMTGMWLYVPVFLVGVPLAVFYEWRQRIRTTVYQTLPSTLRKISSANESGMTFLESVEAAIETADNRLAREFQIVEAKTELGVDLGSALVELNNRYPSPDLARALRLIEEAQKTSQDIAEVLTTTIQAVDDRLELKSEQVNKTRIQMVYILVTNLMLVLILAGLDRAFVPLVSQGGMGAETFGQTVGGMQEGGGSLNASTSSLLFLHALSAHAIISGLLTGYVRTSQITSGIKYVLGLLLVIAVMWGLF